MPEKTPPTVADLAQMRRHQVRQARATWDAAPVHVRVMASQFVCPLLDVLQTMSAEQDARDQAAARAGNRDGLAL